MTSSQTPLAGRTALVTGAAAGLGHATTRALAKNGADVVAADLDEDGLQDLQETIESSTESDCRVIPTNMTKREHVNRLVDRTVEESDGLDIVVSNAGITLEVGVEEMTTEEYERQLGVNIDGTFYLTQEALPHLRKGGGHLIYVGSFAARFPRPFAPVYAGSKHWLRGFAHSLAGRIGSDDIAVTLVNPSEMRTQAGTEYGPPLKERLDPGEASEPEDVAEAIVFSTQTESPNTVSELDFFVRDKYNTIGGI